MIEGRSSIGRLGLFVHVTAGFGDVGFCGYWTLEMFAVQPVRIYAGVAICQIFYHDICGTFTEYASEKYQHNTDIQPSLLFKELSPGCKDPQGTLSFRARAVEHHPETHARKYGHSQTHIKPQIPRLTGGGLSLCSRPTAS